MQTRKYFLLLAVFMLSLSALQAAGITFNHLTLDQAKAKAKSENKLIFVDVYAPWCGPCKYLSRSVFPDADLGAYFNEHFVALKLDGEQSEGRKMMTEYALEAYPSLLFLDSEGNLVKKVVGAMGAEALLEVGKAVVNPEETEVYQLQQRFNSGERGPEFMEEYFDVLVEADQDLDEAAEAYLEAKPTLDLDNETDLMVFFYAVNDIDHPTMGEFIDRAAEMEEDYEIFLDKTNMLLGIYLEQALEQQDPEIAVQVLDKLYPGVKAILGGDAPSRAEIEEALRKDYADNLE